MRAWTLVMALVGLVFATASAQAPRPAAGEYVGVVTGKNVYVRSAPVDGYPCTKLSSPATVRVKGEEFGWLKIVPPPQCYSLIHKDYVKSDDGKAGTVTGTNVLIRAGSELFPQRMGVFQTKLNRGDKVTIRGEQEGYYQIAPPPGVTLWISSLYVKPAGGGTPETAPATTPAETQPTETQPAETQHTETQPTTQEAVVPPVDDDEARARAALEAAEEALKKEFVKPRDQRDVKSLLARYQAIKLPADSELAPYVKARMDFLNMELELEQDRQAIAELVANVKAKQAALAAASVRAQLPPRPARSYAAEGLLRASDLFTGGPTGPRRYIMVDPESRLITAYVQCTTGVVDLPRYVEAYVGVVGTPKYEERLRMYVVEAEQIVVLRAAASGAVRPRPVAPTPEPEVIPFPELEPEPETQPAVEPEPQPQTQPAPATGEDPPTPEPGQDLPATGLPVAESATQPTTRLNEEEYE